MCATIKAVLTSDAPLDPNSYVEDKMVEVNEENVLRSFFYCGM